MRFPPNEWALILGGSSGFGLATAHKLAEHGMHCCIVHRDRRGAMARIEPEFERIRGRGVSLVTMNADALDATAREECLTRLAVALGAEGRVRVLLHSIAFGNLKLLTLEPACEDSGRHRLAAALGVDDGELARTVDALFTAGVDAVAALTDPPAYSSTAFLDDEDFARTIYSMGTSLLTWTRALVERRLFAADARVFGLTSEGNSVAWKGYAAVAAAKAVLESVARAIAVEFAPYGVRANVVQAGITDTPALRAIPGHDHLAAQARRRNPFRRLTTPRDVADVVFLLATDEAAWVNGTLIRVDGGEHVAGAVA
ncbi:MAG: SDR family oxidoreductase [Deltaproteobacteria bacterium]|nr:SDR family oxidoreductase [Deltaproteobacteria bacterium]